MPAKHVANFDYTPPSQEAAAKHPVIFTVGKVAYKHAGKKAWLSTPQFANLGDAIEADLPEILAAKGFDLRGPFDSYDLITYADKKAIDFFVLPVVTALVGIPDPLYRSEMGEATAKLTVKIDLQFLEIITRELMWSKSLDFTELEVPLLEIIQAYEAQYEKITELFFRAEAIENLMAKEVEKQYPVVMGTTYKLIDPEEMLIIKKQAQEVKSKEGY